MLEFWDVMSCMDKKKAGEWYFYRAEKVKDWPLYEAAAVHDAMENEATTKRAHLTLQGYREVSDLIKGDEHFFLIHSLENFGIPGLQHFSLSWRSTCFAQAV